VWWVPLPYSHYDYVGHLLIECVSLCMLLFASVKWLDRRNYCDPSCYSSFKVKIITVFLFSVFIIYGSSIKEWPRMWNDYWVDIYNCVLTKNRNQPEVDTDLQQYMNVLSCEVHNVMMVHSSKTGTTEAIHWRESFQMWHLKSVMKIMFHLKGFSVVCSCFITTHRICLC
jgi:hypothetical protein